MNSVNIPLTLLLFLLPFTTPGVVNSGPFVHSTNGSPNGCPIFQCTTTGSNRISSDRAINVGTSKPQLLWSRTGATFQSLSQNGCVANSINIICGPERVTTNKTIKTMCCSKKYQIDGQPHRFVDKKSTKTLLAASRTFLTDPKPPKTLAEPKF